MSCISDISYVGWTNVLFGLSGALLSFMFGLITKYMTVTPLIIFTQTIVLGHCVFILTWTADETSVYIVFLMTFAFSISQAVAVTQLKG